MVAWVKICGITNKNDAKTAIDLGVNALGFVFADSPRQVTVEQVRRIGEIVPPHVQKIGVFSNHKLQEVERIASSCSLDIVQLHGEESPQFCAALDWPIIKALSVENEISLYGWEKYQVFAFLLDSYQAGQRGGTGQTFDWSLTALITSRIILAGGLNITNVQDAIKMVKPYGVDVSSGVEEKIGQKDRKKMMLFLKKVKECENNVAR